MCGDSLPYGFCGCLFGADPFPNIGRTIPHTNATCFEIREESDDGVVHQSQVFEIEDQVVTCSFRCEHSPQLVQVFPLQTAAEAQDNSIFIFRSSYFPHECSLTFRTQCLDLLARWMTCNRTATTKACINEMRYMT